jgi:flagellar hook-basal body complex protein FliE
MRMVDNEVITQSSFFGYTTPSKRTFSASERFVTDIMGISSPDGEVEGMLELNIRMDQVKIVTNRVYETAFEAFAELGGIISIITFLAVVVSMRVSNTLLMLNLAHIYESTNSAQSRAKADCQRDSSSKLGEKSSGSRLQIPSIFSQVLPKALSKSSHLQQKSEVVKKKFVKHKPPIIKNANDKALSVFGSQLYKAPLVQEPPPSSAKDNQSDQ